MQDVDPLIQITQIIQDIGIWAVFFYLFVQERQAHMITRDKHMEDLREIAGMKPPLQRQLENSDLG